MPGSREHDSAVLNEFLRVFLGDVEAGRARALADYQSLFPGHESLIAREYERASRNASEKPSIAPLAGSAESGASTAFLKKLAEFSSAKPRYQLRGEVARGGMGAILKVWDETLRRNLAMKVVLGREDPLSKGSTPDVDENTLGRFLEEAQVTGQLDHPGVVPVHELGVSEERGVYFTMKLVKGEDLRAVYEKVRAGKDGWTQTRALSVLLKVCEAMAYAHDKKVVHRDLKPSNVMVGKYGEVYVMDWGLAKVLGEADRHDLRLSPQMTTPVRSQRSEQPADSPLITMDGTVVGTPCYMSLEQAEGRLEDLGPRSDVYAMGAMLYELLTGQAPYVRPGSRPSPHTILAALLQGPATPVHELAPNVPAELEAICEKAMARPIEARYRDMGELGADLAAYLERRVVRAYQTGAVAELRKWVERNQALAASAACAVLLLVVGLTTSLVFKARSDRNAKLAEENAAQAKANAEESARNAATAVANEQRALEGERLATARAADVLRLSDLQDLRDLTQQADELWPVVPELILSYETWLREAQRLVDKLPAHETKLGDLRSKALPQSVEERKAERESHPRYDSSDQAVQAVEGELARLEEERGELEAEVNERRDWRFPEGEREARWWNNQLSKLIEGLEDLDMGLLAENGTSAEHGWSVPKRLEFARSLRKKFAEGGEYFRRWSQALPEIRAAYPGLALSQQIGLVPIGPDPESSLWEFAHLQTGEPAERGADGRLVFTERTGLVFVLLPGGTFLMGAQAGDPDAPNFDPQAEEDEGPVHEVTLSPFFLSKYEMTQAQWQGFAGRNPSNRSPANSGSLLNPVEQVSWNDCGEVMQRMELVLPSEAQWEYAARGGTSSPWWTGEERRSLFGAANLLDQAAAEWDGFKEFKDWQEVNDGYGISAPVHLYDPNPFGLHNVHGNVWEWCLDGNNKDSAGLRAARDPVADALSKFRVFRGGGYRNTAVGARSTSGRALMPASAELVLGLRPARRLTP